MRLLTRVAAKACSGLLSGVIPLAVLYASSGCDDSTGQSESTGQKAVYLVESPAADAIGALIGIGHSKDSLLWYESRHIREAVRRAIPDTAQREHRLIVHLKRMNEAGWCTMEALEYRFTVFNAQDRCVLRRYFNESFAEEYDNVQAMRLAVSTEISMCLEMFQELNK